jgi:hypothetical protein
MTITSSSEAGRSPREEAVDTRRPAGPDGRLYLASFAAVWDRVLEAVREQGRWSLVHHDEELGMVTVRCRGLLPGSASLLTIWVSLDDNGLTRLDLRAVPDARRAAGPGDRLIRDFLLGMDRALGPATRVRS